MFDVSGFSASGSPAGVVGGVLDAATVAGWVAALAGLDREVSDAERVDQIRVLEELKAAAAAGQARAAVDLDTSIRTSRAERGLSGDRQGAGVGAQVALARRESPHKGGRYLGFAHALVEEMPHTLAALTAGRLSEWRATLLVQGTACLSREDRAVVDQRLVADPTSLDGVGDQELVRRVRELAYRLDPGAALRRARKAEADRRVTIRPAPDTMVHLTALLPVKAGVAAYAALVRAADTARAVGDPRARGQVMADTLVERLTGRTAATGADLEVQVVITDRTLLRGAHEPAHVPGYGPVPAGLARDWLHPDTPDTPGTPTSPGSPGSPGSGADPAQVRVWLRRLYTHPGTGELVAMDSTRRLFDGNLRTFLIARDQTCRTPWCDAPIRHADHVVPHHAGGPTTAADGQGLCAQCNHTKQAPGWRARPAPGSRPGRHLVETTTPTGHTHRSGAPPQPGTPPPPATPTPRSRVEVYYHDLILTA